MPSITKDPENGGYLLEADTILPLPVDDVFPFFADAMNLEQITPPWLHFHVVTPPPIEMFAGRLIDYRLKIHGVPVGWRTKIECWDPPHRFTDVQLRGPYRYWRHEHEFEQTDAGTRCLDRVRYGVPGGSIVHSLLVRRDVQAIFAYREKMLLQVFDRQPAVDSA